MLPNSQLYVQSYRHLPNLCSLKKGEERCSGNFIREDTADRNTIYDTIKKDNSLQKTLMLIEKAGMRPYFRQIGDLHGTELNGLTLFVCGDDKIPASFIDNISFFRAKTFLNSHTLNGVAYISYLIENGSSIYTTRNGDNPILSIVRQGVHTSGARNLRDVEITINSVGRVVKEVNCSNGNIIYLDNIASSMYVNGTY